MKNRRAFTLIELLTVIAITAVLMTLIIVPLIQSFNLVRAAQSFADAQDKARTLVERISREISNSAGIRDNASYRGVINAPVPGQNGAIVSVSLPYAKIDIIRPAEGDPANVGPSGAFINPNTGREDPTLKGPKGQVVLPVTPGNKIIRYFIGLRDPSQNYNNPYDGLLMARNGLQDNLFVLYKVEVQPYIWANGQYRVNNLYFFDQDRDNDPTTFGPLFDDPDFFNPLVPLPAYAVGPFPGQPADPSKAQMVQNWRSQATLITEVSRYDMVQPVYGKQNRRVIYDNNIPRLIPLVQFRPTGVGNELTTGQAAVRMSEETDNATAIAPDVFRTKLGSWSTLFLRIWPDGLPPSAVNPYLTGRYDTVTKHFGVYHFDPTVNTNEPTDGLLLFDSDGYLESKRTSALYPFSANVVNANLTPATRPNFVPIVADMQTGKLTTSFGIDEVGIAARPDTIPVRATGQAFSPVNATDLGNAWPSPEYQPADVAYEINRSFNKVWREQTTGGSAINFNLLPDVHRFIDLRVAPFSDGSNSPLHPDPTLGFARARIVPGSEIIVGPDQNPGPNYGQPIRYSRVTRNPGPNQYRINYVDLQEPTNGGGAVDYTVFAPGMPNPPATYTANNFVSAIIQPRFKAGYVQLNSDPNVPLPQGNITVSYRFQMNKPKDIIAADYDTRQLMGVMLTIRNYPQTGTTGIPNPQQVTLSATATVRNIVR